MHTHVHTHTSCGYTLCKCLACKCVLPPRVEVSWHSSLLQCGLPPMGDSPPWTFPMWTLPWGCSFSQTAPAWVLPEAAVLQQQAAPVWVSSGSQVLPAKLLQRGLFSPWDHIFPAAWGHSLLWVSPCSGVGFPMGCRWISAPPWPLWAARSHLASPWSSPWAVRDSPAPCSPLTWGLQGCFSHILTPQLQLLLHSSIPILYNVIPDALPLLLIDSSMASGGSILEPAGICSLGHEGNFWQHLTEATCVAPPATKPLPSKPHTLCYCSRLACQTLLNKLIQSISSGFFSLTVLLIWEAVAIRVQCENNSTIPHVLENFWVSWDSQLSLSLLVLLFHWALHVHSWICPLS